MCAPRHLLRSRLACGEGEREEGRKGEGEGEVGREGGRELESREREGPRLRATTVRIVRRAHKQPAA